MALSRLALLAIVSTIVSTISLVLSGCFYTNAAQVPMAKTYPYSEQQRMQAAHHWQVLAEYEATGILQQPHLRATPLYLPKHTDHPRGEFARGYRSLLTSELVSGGAIVQKEPGGAATVDFDVEVINHSDRGFIRPYPGTMTLAALATGISVLVAPSSNAALALIPPVAGADVTSGSWTSVSQEEVIITTKITDNERVLYSSSNIYYINQGDRRHYDPPRAPKPKPIPRIPLDNQW